MSREVSLRDGRPLPVPISHAARVGQIVAASGDAGYDASGRLLDGIDAQVRQTLLNLQGSLASAGATLDDVIMVRVYLANESDFDAMNRVYGEIMPEPYPARTTVFPGLFGEMLVEIDALAVVAP